MNQSQFAKLHGVSRKTVTAWKARGWLVMDGDDVDVDESNHRLKRYRKSIDNGKSNNFKGNVASCNKKETPSQVAERLVVELGADMDIDEAKRVKENYLALLSKLEYEEKSGKLLPLENMLDDVSNEYSRVRTRLSAIAPEHGPRLRQDALSMDDAGFVAALQDVINEAVNELSIDKHKLAQEEI